MTVTLVVGGLIVLLTLLVLLVLRRIGGDLRQLARAARGMGDGDLAASLPIGRRGRIGELAKSLDYLRTCLLTDRLTGIASRATMLRRLEERLVRNRRDGDERPWAVLFIDLDRFGGINDRFGHEAGDRVLVEVSLRLAQSLREQDMVARFEGDEFVVLLDEVSGRADALGTMTHLQSVLAKRYGTIAEFSDEAMLYSRGASIGLALYPEDGRDVETLLRRSRETMHAKKTGSRTLPSGTSPT